MQKSKLTVFFEDPFWVAVYERMSGGKLEVCKVVFGAEPKDHEVYAYFLSHWHTLRFSAPLTAGDRPETRANPKRVQRLVNRELQAKGLGTKAQMALKSQQAAGKIARKRTARMQKEAEKQRSFELKRQKRKEKHKGH